MGVVSKGDTKPGLADLGQEDWPQESSSSQNIRISELEGRSRALGEGIPDLDSRDSSDTNVGTDPDYKPRVAFGVTVPAPTATVATPSAASAVLAKLRKAPRGTPKSGDLIAERYRILHKLGEGGMGIVFEVSHARLGKSFALKLLRPERGDDRSVRTAFFREAKYASSLAHKHLISVLDYGEDAHFGPYMVMELARGVLLSEFLRKRSKLTIKRAADVVLQIAEALAYIHQQDLIHCDLKPQNVIMIASETATRKSYTVKLIDFGLAQSPVSNSTESIFGTPRYLSPEIALREQASQLCDVYSLAVLFFELLTGRPPFDGDTLTLLKAHIHKKPPTISEFRGEEVDPALEQLVTTALQKDPQNRQRSMSALIYELKNFMQMSGLSSGRSLQGAATGSGIAPLPDLRAALVTSAFDAIRLPIAMISSEGSILAANAAFSKFVFGMRVGIEGSNLSDSALASAWTDMSRDIGAACKGASVGRRVEIDLRSGEVVGLQMWLEPTEQSGVVVLSLYRDR